MFLKTDDTFARIEAIGFFGHYLNSSNGLFTISWSDFDRESSLGGFRTSGEGTFVVAKKDEVIHIGKLQRPNDGKISNTGNFIINDWLFGEGLKGIFYAFDLSGKILLKQNFSANLLNNGISKNGQYSVCQCCNSNTDDSNTLNFFDLEQGKLLWKTNPESGWADSYLFDCVKTELHLIYRDKGIYRYSFGGDFLDKEKWETERINYMSAFEISDIAIERFKEKKNVMNEAIAQEIIFLFEYALRKGLEYPNEEALIYRTMGEIKESLGKIPEAIHYYELALEYNTKVGIKRHLDMLKKFNN
jgi:tetratricopeptide (TPR) repeat protein